MIKARTMYAVICDVCLTTLPEKEGSLNAKQSARIDYGWTLSSLDDGIDRCHSCQKNHLDKIVSLTKEDK